MSIHDRLWDDSVFARQGETVEPHTVLALLRRLDVADAVRESQISAMREWFTDHPPSKVMTFSLEATGFADLTPPRTA